MSTLHERTVLKVDGYDRASPVAPARPGSVEYDHPSCRPNCALLYAGKADQYICWSTLTVPESLDGHDSIAFSLPVLLRRDQGGDASFAISVNDHLLATIGAPGCGPSTRWQGDEGSIAFALLFHDHNGDHAGRLTLTVPATWVVPGQPATVTVRGARANDTGADGLPDWQSKRGFFLLPDLPLPVEPAPTVLRLDREQVISSNWWGFGGQGDLFLLNDQYPELAATEAEQEVIRQRILAMRPALVRLFFRLEWWEAEEGVQTPQSMAMRDFRNTLDLYQEVGARVIVNGWNGPPPRWARAEPQRAETAADWMSAARLPHPDRLLAFARSWMAMVKYLRDDCGLTCLVATEPFNEPNGGGMPPRNQGGLTFAEFATVQRHFKQARSELGLDGQVMLLGPDEVDTMMWLPRAATELDDVLDGYNFHLYTSDAAKPFALEVERRLWFLNQVCGRDQKNGFGDRKPALITEFNSSGIDYFDEDKRVTDQYEHGLFLAEAAIRAVQQGINGMLVWHLGDCSYNQHAPLQEGPLVNRIFGLWRFRDRNYAPRPGFYAWSLLTRYAERGSSVYAVEGEGDHARAVAAVAMQAPGCKAPVFLLAHRHPAPLAVALHTGTADQSFVPYLYCRDSVPTLDAGMIGASEPLISDAFGVLRITLPAASFCLLRPGNLKSR